MKWQGHDEDSTTCWAVADIYAAKVVGDDPVDDGKSQSGACSFCREERIEDILEYLLRDSPAGITDRHGNRRYSVELRSTNRHFNLSPTLHGLLGIHE